MTGEGCTSTLHDGDRDEQVIPDASQPGGSFAASQPVKQPKGESGQEEIPASAVQDGARRGIP